MGVETRYISEWLRTQWSAEAAKLISSRSSADPGATQGDVDFTMLLQLLSSEGSAALEQPEKSYASGIDALALMKEKLAPFQINESSDASVGEEVSESLQTIVSEASAKFGVDPSLVKAVIQAESNFRVDAVSPAGAKGLMQLMDSTARAVGVDNSFDPEQNVHGGTRFLRNLLHKYNGNMGVALAAYNAGPGRVDRLGIRTDQDLAERMELLPEETQRYISKVLGFHKQYSED